MKQLFLKNQKACDEFINEVILIINLQHRNLVNLKGYCLNGKEMLLIYEYVDNQDLDKILLSKCIQILWFARVVHSHMSKNVSEIVGAY